MPRDGGNADVQWFDVEPCYVFHPMNAYDDGDTIVLDVVRHPKMFVTDHLGPNEGPPTLDRWTVDLADGKVRESRFDDRGQEFPRVDERLVGKRHRYGYAPAVGEGLSGGAPYSSTISSGAPASRAHSVPIKQWASSSFTHRRGMRQRTTACSWVMSMTGPPTVASWRSWTRKPCRTSPASSCRTECPQGSTATGYRAQTNEHDGRGDPRCCRSHDQRGYLNVSSGGATSHKPGQP